tara:strand:- start:2778 stop:2984 length:207 start_codon:yes stop_codon:yes gene_type:complete
MNKREFMGLHDKVIQEIIDRITRLGEMPRILENTQNPHQRRTVLQINHEVYEVTNDGEKAARVYLGGL